MTWKVPRGWARIRARVLLRDGGVCWLCQKDGADSVDHVIARANGGTHHLSNLKAAHKRCNSSKGASATVMPRANVSRRWG